MWVGEVFVAGLLTLAAPPTAHADEHIDCKGYIEALSTSATYALGGIVATGLGSAWNNVGSLDALTMAAPFFSSWRWLQLQCYLAVSIGISSCHR